MHLCFGRDMINERFEVEYITDFDKLTTEMRMINLQEALNYLQVFDGVKWSVEVRSISRPPSLC